jgi:hypothetical protein
MKCRHCGQLISLPFLDLGSAPPSNAYLGKTDLNGPETWFPLRLLVCENCWLVQTEDHTGREAYLPKTMLTLVLTLAHGWLMLSIMYQKSWNVFI